MMRETGKSVQEINVKQALEELIKVTKEKTLRQIGLINLDDFSYLEKVGLIDVSEARHSLSAAYFSLSDALREFEKYVETASEEDIKRRINDVVDVEAVVEKMFDTAAVWFMHFADDVRSRLSSKQNALPSALSNRVDAMLYEIAKAIASIDKEQYQLLLEQHITAYWMAQITRNDELADSEYLEIGSVLDKALGTIADTAINKYLDEEATKSIVEEGFENLLDEVCKGIWEHLNGYDIASEVLCALED